MTAPTIDARFLERWSAKVRAKGERIHELEEEIADLADALHTKRLELRTLRGDLEALSRSRTLECGLFEDEPQAWPESYRDVPLARIGLSEALLESLAERGLTKLGDICAAGEVHVGGGLSAPARDEIENRIEFLFAEHAEYVAERDREGMDGE